MKYLFSDQCSDITILGALAYFATEMGRVLCTHEPSSELTIVALGTIGLCVRAAFGVVKRMRQAKSGVKP